MPAGPLGHEEGEVFALTLGQSTGHRLVVEALPDGRRHALIGPMLDVPPAPATSPPGAALRDPARRGGANGVVNAFHRHLRRPRGALSRSGPPAAGCTYNCWEAVYFRHDVAEIKEIATRAATLGAERFRPRRRLVRPARRRHDEPRRTGSVDGRQVPRGARTADRPRARARHDVRPLGRAGDGEPRLSGPRPRASGLDSSARRGSRSRATSSFSTSPARMCATTSSRRSTKLLAAQEIRLISSGTTTGALPGPDHRQADGFPTRCLERLFRAAHPMVEIESCASGGRTARLGGAGAHASASGCRTRTTALERLRIQHEALPFLIPEVTGSPCRAAYLPPRPGATLADWRFAPGTAAQRHFGLRDGPARASTPTRPRRSARVACWWKDRRDWLIAGRAACASDVEDAARLAELANRAGRGFPRFALWVAQIGGGLRIFLPARLAPRGPGAGGVLSGMAREPGRRSSPRVARVGSATRFKGTAGALVPFSGAALAGAGLAPAAAVARERPLVLEGERLP